MPKVTIDVTTTPEEQEKVFEAIKFLLSRCDSSTPIAVSKIAKYAHLNANRVRYIVEDLADLGRITRIPLKAYNSHYMRYGYRINTDSAEQ